MDFHVSWHIVAPQPSPEPAWQGPHGALGTLLVDEADFYRPWPISFEAAIARLEALPGMFCEWDGAWVWHPAPGEQIEGVLFDRADRLAYVELKGRCNGARVDLLTVTLGARTDQLMVQLPREGVVLHWKTWRNAWFA